MFQVSHVIFMLSKWWKTMPLNFDNGGHTFLWGPQCFFFKESNATMWPITAKSSNIDCSQTISFSIFLFLFFFVNCQYTVPNKYDWPHWGSFDLSPPKVIPLMFCSGFFPSICWTLTVSPECLHLFSQWFVAVVKLHC